MNDFIKKFEKSNYQQQITDINDINKILAGKLINEDKIKNSFISEIDEFTKFCKNDLKLKFDKTDSKCFLVNKSDYYTLELRSSYFKLYDSDKFIVDFYFVYNSQVSGWNG